MKDVKKEFTGVFEQDVPEHLRDDILQRIEEVVWFDGKDPDIDVYDLVKHNVMNIEYMGTIRIDGVEHHFHIRSGDWNGTEILSWNGDSSIDRTPPPRRMIIPSMSAVGDAIASGRAMALLEKWDIDMRPGSEIGKILSSAAYDAFFAPGTGASRHHYDKVYKEGYEIDDADSATPVRFRLLEAAWRLAPTSLDGSPQTLVDWDRDRSEGPGQLRKEALRNIARRGGITPLPEDQADLFACGYRLVSAAEERVIWHRLASGAISLEPIEGFDPKDLPENPVARLFHTLDPALVSDLRVNPEYEGERLLESIASTMARDRTIKVPDYVHEMAASIGFRVLSLEVVETDQSVSPEM